MGIIIKITEKFVSISGKTSLLFLCDYAGKSVEINHVSS